MRHSKPSAPWRGACSWLIVVLLTLIPPVAVSGQAVAEGPAHVRDFWVTEAGYSHSLAGPCADHYPSFEIGKLVNLRNSVAAGATIFVGHNGDLVFGPVPRFRYRVSEDLSVDLAGGILFGASRARPMGYVSMNYRDLFSGFVQYELYRDGGCGQPTEDQLFLGVKVGSSQGVWTLGVGGVLAGILIVVAIAGIEN